MRHRPLLIILLPVLVLTQLALAQAASQPATAPATPPGRQLWEATDEDYAVWSIVLPRYYAFYRWELPPQILVAERTEDWRLFDDDDFDFEESALFRPRRWELQPALVESNRQPARIIAERFKIGGSEILLREQDHYQFPAHPRNLLEVWRKYPASRGVFLLSRPGYSAKRDRAIVHINFQPYGENGGSGLMYLLKKEDGVWRVDAVELSWIS